MNVEKQLTDSETIKETAPCTIRDTVQDFPISKIPATLVHTNKRILALSQAESKNHNESYIADIPLKYITGIKSYNISEYTYSFRDRILTTIIELLAFIALAPIASVVPSEGTMFFGGAFLLYSIFWIYSITSKDRFTGVKITGMNTEIIAVYNSRRTKDDTDISSVARKIRADII